MKSKVTIFLPALLVNLTFAVTPGCLLQAVNTQNEPSNLSAVCGNGARDVQVYIGNNCGSFEEAVQKAFIDTCSSAGTSVAPYTTSFLSSTRTTSRSTSMERSTTLIQTSASTSDSSSSSTSSASSTAGANVDHKQAAMGPMAAAAIALVGAVAAL